MIGSTSFAWPKRLGRVVPALVFGLAALAAMPEARAQNDVQALSDKVDRLQQEVSDLERQVYNGQGSGTGAVATDTGGASTAASQEVRLQQLEQQMRDLTGQVEKLGYSVQQLSARTAKLSQDVDFRLTQLEHNQPAAAAAAPAQPATTGAATGTDQGNQPLKQSSLAPQTLGTLTQSQVQAAAQQPAAGETPPAATSAAETAAAAAYKLPGNTVEEQYQYAFGLLQQANYDEAEKALRAFVAQHPTDFLAGNAQYWLGETYYVRGRYEDAAVTFAEGYQKYPDNSKAPDDLLKLGMSLGQIGKKSDACVAFAELGKKFPSAPDNVLARVKDEKHRYGCR
ncbi:MAG TPA: tol-pal system protein YbgF [Candidatus Udaeobacter sp.]|nr:tol-pal system protein YbgF [Candidatus Udaeobacter sp.]